MSWKLSFGGLGVLGIASIIAFSALAQPPEGREPEGGKTGPPERRGPERSGGPEGRGGEGERRPPAPPPSPLLDALDTDGDHVISAKEIENASKSLLALDKNKDGQISEDEFRPAFGPGGPEGRGGEGRGGEEGQRGPRGKGDRPQGKRGPRGEGRGGPGGPGGPPSTERFVEHALSFDADKDGKLDKAELTKLGDEMGRRFGPPGGGRGGPPGRPEGGPDGGPDDGPPGRRPDGGGDRPERPRQPE